MEKIYENLLNFKNESIEVGKTVLDGISNLIAPGDLHTVVATTIALVVWSATIIYLIRKKDKK